jgi:hypothetical protein
MASQLRSQRVLKIFFLCNNCELSLSLSLSLSLLYCRYKDYADDERMQTPEDSIELLYADGVPELGTSRSVAAHSTGRLKAGK